MPETQDAPTNETNDALPPTDSPLDGKTVVIADDDPDVQQGVETAMEPLGAKILLAKNGDQAVKVIEENEVDLIILDVMMPGRSGFLVAEAVKKGKGPSEKPYIIMITANEGKRHQVWAESQIGVNAYFQKPVPLRKLVEAAEGLFKDE